MRNGKTRLERDVAAGVHRVTDAYVNWYLIEDDERLTVVDAGLPTSWRSLLDALHELGRTLRDIGALVLTHGHFDHLGFAERLRREAGVPVHVHTDDVPLTRHPRQYTRARPLSWYLLTQVRAMPMVAAFVRNRAWWPKPIVRVERITEEGVLPVPGSPHILFTPGHTLGHCALHLPDRDVLLAGDAVVTLNPYRGTQGGQIVSNAATADPERALASLSVLEGTGASTVLTGHGEPWRDGISALVRAARVQGPS